jgi:hypothetical protein
MKRSTLNVVNSPDQCPANVQQIAEEYCMGNLPPSEATVFEDHYITRCRCAAVAEEVDQYVRAMRNAAMRGGSAAGAS